MALQARVIFLGHRAPARARRPSGSPSGCGVPHLSTGDMLRDAHRARNTELGRLAKPIMERGELVPDELVLKMVEEQLSRPDCDAGSCSTVFRGPCRRPKSWTGFWRAGGFGKPVVIHFLVSRSQLMRRLTGRWTCSVGGEIYNIFERPPKVAGDLRRRWRRADAARRTTSRKS